MPKQFFKHKHYLQNLYEFFLNVSDNHQVHISELKTRFTGKKHPWKNQFKIHFIARLINSHQLPMSMLSIHKYSDFANSKLTVINVSQYFILVYWLFFNSLSILLVLLLSLNFYFMLLLLELDWSLYIDDSQDLGNQSKVTQKPITVVYRTHSSYYFRKINSDLYLLFCI